ncbi:MAG: DUF5067 domain-containing protein [Lachnospiraceae bacterium]|nr:DUF5067 domain-containing protein [Lachnospiraceae bacterium]
MANEIEVKKIRRRKKKQPEDVKSVKSASSVSELYQNHASDVQKMKENTKVLPKPENIPEKPSDLRMPGDTGRLEAVNVSETADIGEALKDSPNTQAVPDTQTAQTAQTETKIRETERDIARRSALNNISTFSELHEEPAQKKKKVVVKEKPFLRKPKSSAENQAEPQGNIYLELERQGVGKPDPDTFPDEEENTGGNANAYEKAEKYSEPYGQGRAGAMPEYNRQNAVEDYQTYNEESHKKRIRIINIAVLIVEVIILGVVLYYLFHYKNLLEKGDFEALESENTEYSGEGNGGYESVNAPATIDFSNDKFALKCTRLQITKDVDGNPAALIYFTFVNKTDTPLSMTEVFPPMVVQDEIMCETFAQIESPPDEFYSKDTQIANGEGIDCAFSVKLQNTTDPVELTIHDNYETYEDVASTVINLQ